MIVAKNRSGLWLWGVCLVLSLAGGGVSRAQDSDNAFAKLPVRQLPRFDLTVYLDAAGKTQPVTTTEQWEQRRATTQQAMQAVMGGLPERPQPWDFEAKFLETVDCGSYLRHKVTYRSQPGGHVPAYLCVPKVCVETGRRVPAVLCLHPTDDRFGNQVVLGIAGRPNRQYAAELAERGFVTLAPAYPLLADYQPDLQQLGWQSGTLKAVYDNQRGLDWLETLEWVDASRGFAAIGHSLGGHNAVYTAVFDSRIQCIVSSCGLDAYVDYYDGDPQNWQPERGWCQTRYIPGLAAYRGRLDEIPFDFPEMIGCLAPRRVLIIAPLRDSNFRWQSVDRVAEAARSVYRLYQAESRLDVEHPDCEHDFPDAMRELAYQRIESVLLPDSR